MKKLLSSLAAILLFTPLCALGQEAQEGETAAEDDRPGVMLWEITAKEGVTEANIESITGYISAEIERVSGRKVFTKADVRTILQVDEARQKCGADTTSCIAEIGGALGVPEAVGGDLGRVGSFWLLNLRRVDVREAKIISRVGRKVEGSIDNLLGHIPNAVEELFGVPEADRTPVRVRAALTSESKSSYRIAAYSLLGAGAAMVVVGGVGVWQADEARDSYQSSRGADSGAKDDHEAWKAVSIAGFAAGGAAIVAGVILWALDPTDEEAKGAEVSFTVNPFAEGFSCGVAGRW